MRWRDIKIIFFKELRDVLRDWRTLLGMVIVPALAMPFVILFLPRLVLYLMESELAAPSRIIVVGSGTLADAFRHNPEFEVVSAGDPREALSKGEAEAAVVIPPEFEKSLQSPVPEKITVLGDSTELRQQVAQQKVEQVVREYQDQWLANRTGIPRDLLRSWVVTEDIATEVRKEGALLAKILPYVLIFLCLTGAAYVAIDLTAGEKERGTMETLLVAPAQRNSIVTAKLGAVFAASVTTAVVAIASMWISFELFGGPGTLGGRAATQLIRFTVPFSSMALIFLLVLPLAATFSCVLMSVALFARSYREAMSYLSPLMIFVLLPAMASILPGIEPTLWFGWIPIVNVSLGVSSILKGEPDWAYLATTLASTAVLCGAALVVALRLFHRESVLFRTV